MMRRFFSFFSGVILGSLVGAAIAVLVAPESGEELRTRIQANVARLQGELRQAATDRRADLQAQLAALRAPQPKAPPTETE